MQLVNTPTPTHVINPATLRGLVLGRRISVSPEVAALMVSIAFGEPRDHIGALPASTSGRC